MRLGIRPVSGQNGEHFTPPWGRLLAHTVAGHHAGLQDGVVARIEEKANLPFPRPVLGLPVASYCPRAFLLISAA
jgi:hypothetical protein